MENKQSSIVNFFLSIIPVSGTKAEEIASAFYPVSYKKGDFLLKSGEISDDYLYLEKGLMRTYLLDLQGKEITTDFFIDNNVVFEITSFFTRVRSEVNIQAVTDCIGYRISYKELDALFHEKSTFRNLGRAILVKEFIASKKWNYSMINKTAEQRYQELLSTKPQVLKHATLKHIATFLGITDTSLSRLRRKI